MRFGRHVMANLTYRALGPDDFDALHRIASDWSVVRQLGGWPWPATPDFTKSRCKPYGGNGFVWGICVDGTLGGSVAVTDGELGYMLHPDFAGRGIMSQATTDALNHACTDYDFTEFHASAWHDNPASKRILEKLGFWHWQTQFVHAKARGFPVACHFMRMPRDKWDGLSKAAQ